MEQYIFTYFNQKYGLKQLAVEHAATLVNSLKEFVSIDPNIAVFGKILKNECEEGFEQFQEYTQNTIDKIIKEILRFKNPNMEEGKITAKLIRIRKQQIPKNMRNTILAKLFDEPTMEKLIGRISQVQEAKVD